MKILVADDDPLLRELICDILAKEGFTAVPAGDGQEALDVFFDTPDVDLVVLDVMMPRYDGWEVLATIRAHADVPVVMLTALGDERHEVFGLKKGADDYIAKPFRYEVFLARIHAQLRKAMKETAGDLLAGDLLVNPTTHRVLVCGEAADLNNKEYHLLLCLLRNRNVVLCRDQILEKVWGYDFEGDARTIDTHVKTLRAKLGACGSYIRTVRGTGYVFEVPA